MLTSEILSFFPDGENWKKNTLFWPQGGENPRSATDHFQIIWDLSSCIKRTSGGGICNISWLFSGSLLWKQMWSLTSSPSPTPSASSQSIQIVTGMAIWMVLSYWIFVDILVRNKPELSLTIYTPPPSFCYWKVGGLSSFQHQEPRLFTHTLIQAHTYTHTHKHPHHGCQTV